ncbi:helix-turn-helix domain-containing protein [Microbacterium sp. ZW T5_56]|uniref:helix-turn-helix domain-containing protein n=1 Tax=Microbacterium sp. ZW T5_56 TaxID=3378081 RepID=UPI00385395B8
MHPRSSLSDDQRATAVALFEAGWGPESVATDLMVRLNPVRRLYDRWRVRGGGALVTKTTKQVFSFEVKLDVVQRFLAGETKSDLAREFSLSSPKLIETWARKYREEGEDALRPKRRGRPPAEDADSTEASELARLRRENARLQAEVAYLGKLRALMEQQRRSK